VTHRCTRRFGSFQQPGQFRGFGPIDRPIIATLFEKPNEANRLSAREMIGPINRELTIQSALFSIASLCLSVKVTIGRLTNYNPTLLQGAEIPEATMGKNI
jgi:hypothetical protein